MSKTYKTRDGRAVRIYATDGGHGKPVHGAIQERSGEWLPANWTEEGRWFRGDSPNQSTDLIEVKPLQTRWVNVYRGCESFSYASRAGADDVTGKDRIACVKIIFTEGQFDE